MFLCWYSSRCNVLSLRDTEIGAEGAAAIAEALTIDSALQELKWVQCLFPVCACSDVRVCARVQAQQRTLRLLRVVVVIFARVFDLPHPFSHHPPPLEVFTLVYFSTELRHPTPPHCHMMLL